MAFSWEQFQVLTNLIHNIFEDYILGLFPHLPEANQLICLQWRSSSLNRDGNLYCNVILRISFKLQYFRNNIRSTIWSHLHNDVIKWKHFPRCWPFVLGIHRSPVNSPHKGQWRGALMLSLICAWINCWVNNREASDLRRRCAHYDVIVMRTPDMLQICSMGFKP